MLMQTVWFGLVLFGSFVVFWFLVFTNRRRRFILITHRKTPYEFHYRLIHTHLFLSISVTLSLIHFVLFSWNIKSDIYICVVCFWYFLPLVLRCVHVFVCAPNDDSSSTCERLFWCCCCVIVVFRHHFFWKFSLCGSSGDYHGDGANDVGISSSHSRRRKSNHLNCTREFLSLQ